MITGTTSLIAHIGFPTHTFKSPMIYNPYFEQAGIDAIVVPMGCRPEAYPALLKAVFKLENIKGDETDQTWALLRVEQTNHEVLKVFAGQNNPFLDNF